MLKAKTKESNILAVWQPIGHSTNHLTKMIAEKLGVKTTHTGTLDPMAEGVVIILLGENRLQKQKYSDFHKFYEFDICFGITTDSYDGLGFIKKTSFPLDLSKKALQENLNLLCGDYTQKVPLFSAIKHKGKKLYKWGNNPEFTDDLPEKSGYIYNLKLLEFSQVSFVSVVNSILDKLFKINGTFRQDRIINQWQEVLANTTDFPKNVYVAKISAEISRGLYVRSLAQDIAKKLNTVGFVTALTRTKNGNFSKENCYSPSDIL